MTQPVPFGATKSSSQASGDHPSTAGGQVCPLWSPPVQNAACVVAEQQTPCLFCGRCAWASHIFSVDTFAAITNHSRP